MNLIPLHNGFLFKFINETTSGQFISRNRGQIIIAAPETSEQGKYARWGQVVAVGPAVKDFKVNDIVLISPGKWTLGFDFEGEKYWKSDDEHVLALGDETVTYEYG